VAEASSAGPRAPARTLPLVELLLLAAMAALLVASSLHKRLSYDEVDNLAYGYRFLHEGPGASPRGQRMPVLALSAAPCLHKQCRLTYVNRTEARRLCTRAATIVTALALGAIVWIWAGQLFGRAAALVALALYALNPDFLAHGKQVTSDVQASLFVTAAVHVLWRFRRRFALPALVAVAAATTGAIASKLTSVLLLPILGALAAYESAGRDRSARQTRWPIARAASLSVAFLALVGVLLNAVYLFDGVFEPADSLAWRSHALQPLQRVRVPLLLPRMFLWTVDQSFVVQENPTLASGVNYVLGELNRDGRWYAFPLMLLLKTPLALFALVAWSVAAMARTHPERAELPWLVVPPLAWLVFFSYVRPQIGVRYLLPAVPFLIVLASRAASGARTRRARAALVALVAWYGASSLSYHPHYMAYFNELIGRRTNAYRYLADSNLDWEDEWHFISEFKRRHPEMPFVYDPGEPQAGFVLVSANDLVGVFDPERYRWLRENFTPVGHVAYSQLLFYVPPDRLEELRRSNASR
jgi:hypothetical protein